jgi:hypothetical protein
LVAGEEVFAGCGAGFGVELVLGGGDGDVCQRC